LVIFTTWAVTALRSSPESAGDSPSGEHVTRKSIPSAICQLTIDSRAEKSIFPRSSNGVTSAVPHPRRSNFIDRQSIAFERRDESDDVVVATARQDEQAGVSRASDEGGREVAVRSMPVLTP
jgi:hypothetical protein